jgi:hypothetical protein
MRRTALRLMLPFLLLAQVMVGVSPGNAVCIALDACCGAHVHGADAGAAHPSHDELHALDALHSHACPEDCTHGGCDGPSHCEEDCSEGSTHFHVALPDDGGCMRDRSNDHFCDLRLLAPALTVFAIQPVVDLHAQATPPPPWIWPDCDRATALRTDCLLI